MDINFLKDSVDYGVIGLLLFMSFLSVWFYIERLLFFKNIKLEEYKEKQLLEIDITKHLTIISSNGSNAPYIGLLGTVFGIIITFYTMGTTSDIDVKMIMSSLALALKATAMGLIVAIPSMFFYNHLARKIEVVIALWEVQQKENRAD